MSADLPVLAVRSFVLSCSSLHRCFCRFQVPCSLFLAGLLVSVGWLGRRVYSCAAWFMFRFVSGLMVDGLSQITEIRGFFMRFFLFNGFDGTGM